MYATELAKTAADRRTASPLSIGKENRWIKAPPAGNAVLSVRLAPDKLRPAPCRINIPPSLNTILLSPGEDYTPHMGGYS